MTRSTLVFFVVLSLFSLQLCTSPSLKIAMRNKSIIALKDALAPKVASKVNFALPGVQVSHSGIMFRVEEPTVRIGSSFRSAQVEVNFMPYSSTIRVSGRIGMVGTANVTTIMGYLSKTTEAAISVNDVKFEAQIALSNTTEGRLRVTVEFVNVEAILASQVTVKFGRDVLKPDLAAQIVRGHFASKVPNLLSSDLSAKLASVVNSVLATFPLESDVGGGLSLRAQFNAYPYFNPGYLRSTLVSYIHKNEKSGPPPYEPRVVPPEFDNANPKLIQFFMSELVAISGAEAAFEAKTLKIKLDHILSPHKVSMTCRANAVPLVEFSSKTGAKASLPVGCVVFTDSAVGINMSVDLVATLNVEVDDDEKVVFTVQNAKLSKLTYNEQPPEWFKDEIVTVAQLAIREVNRELTTRGIPLPVMEGMVLNEAEVTVNDGYVEVCADPTFK